jgi:UrcA family protein
MKTLMMNLTAALGCLVLTSAFAERAPTRPSPTELASGGINRDSGHMPRTFDGLAANQTESVVVRFANLDIESSAGAAVLYSRLQSAAKAVCPEYHSRDLSRLHFGRACYNTAVSEAVAKIDHQSLTALHASRVPLFASHGAEG